MISTIEQLKREFFEKLEIELDKCFPKGKCKERGKALVFNAMANLIFNNIVSTHFISVSKHKQEIEKMNEEFARKMINLNQPVFNSGYETANKEWQEKIEKAKLPCPNPYGKYVKVERVNMILDQLLN